jgi:glutaredoxin 3
MRYIILILTVVIISVGGYFLLHSPYEENNKVLEEETFAACEMNVIMYSSPTCKYCIGAKEIFDSIDLPFSVIDITKDQTRRTEMMERSGRNTVPQIYINDHHVGGFDDLKALKSSGKLKKFLQTCNTDNLK